MSGRWRRIAGCLRAPMFSPAGFLVRAVLLAAAYGACHAAGLREHMSLLSGTPPAAGPGADPTWTMALAAAYAFCYFAFVLAVPVLVLAAGLLALLGGARGARADACPPAPPAPAPPPAAPDGAGAPARG